VRLRQTIRLGLVVGFVARVALGAGPETGGSPPAPSAPPPVACGAGGVELTVALAYDHNKLGKVAGAYLELQFRKPLAVPGTAPQLRSRFKSLMPSEYRVASPTQEAPGKLRVALTTTEPGIPPMDAFKLRFDCPKGAEIGPDQVTCVTSQVVDGSGIPMDTTLASRVRCLVSKIEPVHSAARGAD
jgi:hypothetical protein